MVSFTNTVNKKSYEQDVAVKLDNIGIFKEGVDAAGGASSGGGPAGGKVPKIAKDMEFLLAHKKDTDSKLLISFEACVV